MKQAEGFKSKYVPHSCLEPRDSSDVYWKQKRNLQFPTGRSARSSEPIASYYSTTSYKPQRSHAYTNSAYSKYSPVPSGNPLHLQNHSKFSKDKRYSSSCSTVRKNRFDEELGNIEEATFVDREQVNSTENNTEEDDEEEATEDDQEEPGEFLNEDCEEREADNEIDEEFDESPQTHRAQRGIRNETFIRPQRWRPVEQPETLRHYCQQHIPLMKNHPPPSRYYHTAVEHELTEPLSEEDFVRPSSKSPTRRQLADYRQWPSSRNETGRYDDVTPSMQRRARTKPDLDQIIEAELYRMRRCNRCGNLSGRRNELLTKIPCRFDDRASVPIKGPIGDEPEIHDQSYCGRCNTRHSPKESVPIDVSGPLQSKSRRSRDTKSSRIYEAPEKVHLDKHLPDLSRSSRYSRKSTDAFAEKPKRSLHTSHGSARIPARFPE